ncbi:MAG: MmcQ/YjbR family DNA-binding protein [Aquihabitans sp.]
MTAPGDVDDAVLQELRRICSALPEAYEEPAWVGVRWKVRSHTFAHVLTIDDGRPAAHARAAGTDGPATVVTFRSEGEELEVLRRSGHPYFFGGWGRDVVGLVLDDATDWSEVEELLTESFCFLAPQKLAAVVARPPG